MSRNKLALVTETPETELWLISEGKQIELILRSRYSNAEIRYPITEPEARALIRVLADHFGIQP